MSAATATQQQAESESEMEDESEMQHESETCVCGDPAEHDGWCRSCIADGMRRDADEQREDARR